MADKLPNKNHIRTKETRALLLKAAEAVFVRDGYEAAELGEIATSAGRSKGAIYAHFDSKEDLFLALYKERSAEYTKQANSALEGATSQEQSLKLLRKFFVGLVGDKTWALLTLEFKLYAKRHPDSNERLLKLYAENSVKDQEGLLAKAIGPAGKGAAYLTRAAASAALAAVFQAVMLEAEFAPVLAEPSMQAKVLGHMFDCVMRSKPE